MKDFINNLLSESSKVSMTRFLSAICVFTSVLIVAYAMIKDINLDSIIGICSTFLGFGLGAKVVQKNLESKQETQIEAQKE